MEIYLELLIFIYYLCVIFLTMILFSFIFSIISNRLFGKNPNKTKLYYLEMFAIWIIIAGLIFYYKMNLNEYNKDKIAKFINFNEKNETYENIHDQIDNLEKFDIVVIFGFVLIFTFSQHHSFNEKITLLKDDLSIFI